MIAVHQGKRGEHEPLEMVNTQIPCIYLPSIAQRAAKCQYTEASGARFSVESKRLSLNSKTRKFVSRFTERRFNLRTDYQIERLGESAIVIELPEREVRFDGYTIKTQLPSYSRQQQLCGLCGNNDDECTTEFMTAENTETEDLEKFHRSYLFKNKECETEEKRLTEKKNYRKVHRKKKWKSKRKPQLVEKTQIKERSHRICFSMEPVAECRRGFVPESRLTKKIRFTCMPRHSINARRLMKEARQEPLQLDDYTTSFVESVKVPTACVAY